MVTEMSLRMYLSFIAIFMGALTRALSPARRKRKEIEKKLEVFKWDQRYTYSLMISLILSFTVTAMLFLTYQIPAEVPFFILILGGYVEGFTNNALIIEIGKILGFFEDSAEEPIPE